jgi:hypothetical protein
MIINLLINFLLLIFGSLFVFFPVVSISTIPLVGPSIYSSLVFMVTTWNSFMVTFPYAQVLWDSFLYIIIPFEVVMLVLKFFLGHRAPANLN